MNVIFVGGVSVKVGFVSVEGLSVGVVGTRHGLVVGAGAVLAE